MVETMQNIIEQPIPAENMEAVAAERNWRNYAQSICALAEAYKNESLS
jgi:uncharacterized protein YjiS (DUF1127 family)